MHDITITIKADEKLLALGEKLLTIAEKQQDMMKDAKSAVETVIQCGDTKPGKSVTLQQEINKLKTAPPVQPEISPNPTVQQSAPVVTAAPIQQPAPTTAPKPYTLEQLSFAAAPLLDAGKDKELMAVIQSFGVMSLQQLPTEKYGEFAAAIRSLGAQI